MKDILVQLAQSLSTLAKLLRPDGVRAIVAESFLLKPKLLIVNRSRRRQTDNTAIRSLLSNDLMDLMIRVGLIARVAILCVHINAKLEATQ